MFRKTLKSLIRELGRIDEKYKRVYKSPKKYKSVTIENYCSLCNSTKSQMLEKDDSWFVKLQVKTGFPIDCSTFDNEYKETIWHHIYTLYISAMKEKTPHIVSFLLRSSNEDDKDFLNTYKYKNNDEKVEFEHALHIYKLLVNKNPDLTQISQGFSIPTNIHNLALDIAKDLQKDDSFKKLAEENKNVFSKTQPPSIESLMSTMSSNPSIQNLFSTVSSKIQEKIDNNEINPSELAEQADGFLKSIDLNPMLKSLQNQMKNK